MTCSNRTTWLLSTTAALLLLAGCNGSDTAEPDVSATPPTAPTAEAAPTTTAPDEVEVTSESPALSAGEQDEADIEATVVAYLGALDEAYAGADIEVIYPWSRDAARDTWTTQLMAYREQGVTFEGSVEAEVLDVVVDEDQADVSACLDYSNSRAIDAAGEDVSPTFEAQQWQSSYVLEREASTEYGWIVVQDMDEDEPCGR